MTNANKDATSVILNLIQNLSGGLMNRIRLMLVGFTMLIALLLACGGPPAKEPPGTGGEPMTITITSSAFEPGGMIPKKYTGDGEDVSPPLALANVPEPAKSLALICDDPDAPAGDWVHWVLYNIPAGVREIPEDIGPDKRVAGMGIQGRNDFGKIGYAGPLPPSGTHRYFFKVYALDIVLSPEPTLSKAMLLKVMEGHILARGELMGRYARQ
jgi:Raf kinase inhibitor-like YbhB/YbcL family protein